MAPRDSNLDPWQLDRDHVLHPWCHFDSFKEEGSLVLETGSGCVVTDRDGKSYIDGIGGLWCTNIGLGNEDMVAAIADQVRQLAYANTFVDTTTPPAALLGGKLAEIAPGDINRVFYTTGGSTANDSAYRLVQYYQRVRGKPYKRQIISRKASYHGSTYLSASLSGKAADRSPFFEYHSDNIHHISNPTPYRAPDGMDEAQFLEFLVDEFEAKIHELGPDNVAAFISEPVTGAGGVVVPPKGYHKRFKEVCERYDILYWTDEVVTGFGRLGHWFATKDEFEVQPDIIVCAKGISSGYIPLGACLYSERIHEVISNVGPEHLFTNGFTYSCHPVACAAALKNIEIFEKTNLLAYAREIGDYFEQQVKTLADLPMVGEARGRRLMAGIEYVADKSTKKLLPDEINISKRISNACEARGVFVRPVGHLNVLSPALVISREQVDTIVSVLRDANKAVIDELTREGVKVAG